MSIFDNAVCSHCWTHDYCTKNYTTLCKICIERPSKLAAAPTVVAIQPALDFLDSVKAMLVEKNKAYGNSALEPTRVFSRATPVEQLLVRIDDKLSRIKSGTADNEDTIKDLVGYLALLWAAQRGGK